MFVNALPTFVRSLVYVYIFIFPFINSHFFLYHPHKIKLLLLYVLLLLCVPDKGGHPTSIYLSPWKFTPVYCKAHWSKWPREESLAKERKRQLVSHLPRNVSLFDVFAPLPAPHQHRPAFSDNVAALRSRTINHDVIPLFLLLSFFPSSSRRTRRKTTSPWPRRDAFWRNAHTGT